MEVNYPGVIVRGAIILVLTVRGQFFWGSLFGAQLSWGGSIFRGRHVTWGAIVRVAIVRRAIIQRAIVRVAIILGAIVLEPILA